MLPYIFLFLPIFSNILPHVLHNFVRLVIKISSKLLKETHKVHGLKGHSRPWCPTFHASDKQEVSLSVF